MENTAVFPGAIWDGDSPSRLNAPAPDRGPDYQDWNQVVAEVAAVQDMVKNGSASAGGTVATGFTASQSGVGLRQTVITIPSTDLTTTDEATHGAFTSHKLMDFPEGNIHILGAVASIALTAGAGGLTDTSAIVAGVGHVAAAQSAADGTLAANEASIIPSTALTLSGGVKAATAMVSTGAKTVDGHTSPGAAYLNFQTPTAGSSATDTLTISGSVTITWLSLGDA